MLRRTVVTAPLDRVRSVDLESSLLHRLLGLTTVTIGTGVDDTRIELDSLATTRADRLRVELLQRAPRGRTRHRHAAGDPPARPDPGRPPALRHRPTAEELARIDWSWLRFAPFSLSRLVVVAAAFGALSQFFDNLPLDRVGDAWQWLGLAGAAGAGERRSPSRAWSAGC